MKLWPFKGPGRPLDHRRLALEADADGLDQEAFDHWLALAEGGGAEAAYIVGERLETGKGALQSFVEATEWFRKSAELGWAPAYGKLGEIYFSGRRATLAASGGAATEDGPVASGALATFAAKAKAIPADHKEAAYWNAKAAAEGDVKAQVRLGYQYSAGLGVDVDFLQAEHWFVEAAEKEDDGADVGLGMLLAGGHGRSKDTAEAAFWFGRAADKGNLRAKICLAVLLDQAEPPLRDEARAVTLLSEAAEVRAPEAMFLLGEHKRFGVGCAVDLSEAETWLRRAALGGHVRAMVSAGAMLRSRSDPDYNSAAAFFREAADLGDPDAQYALGEFYIEGLGVPKDAGEAARWFEKAASKGVVRAYERLGALYADGLGLKQDFKAAAEWFDKAAADGVSGQYQLGVIHQQGLDGVRNADLALHHFSLASDSGDARASLRLGVLYAQGELVSQDYAKAAEFYRLAAKQGSADAAVNLAFLEIRNIVGNHADGLERLQSIASGGDARAAWTLHQLFSDGQYAAKDRDQAETWLLKAAALRHPPAIAALGQMLREGVPLSASPGELVALISEAAEAGDVAAQSELGLLLVQGRHVPADAPKALQLLSQAASKGHTLSQAWLGDVLATGQGVAKDIDASRNWHRRAARQGHVGALLALTASAPAPGLDAAEDEELVSLWTRRAEAGDPLAQRMIGDFMVRGVRTSQSIETGCHWLRRAALQGNTAAMMILSGLLLTGGAKAEDPEEAQRLLQTAAEKGSLEALYNLGICNRDGLQMPQDRRAATHWLRRAADQNYPPAQLALADMILEGSSSSADLAEAKDWYSAAAEKGSIQAWMKLGMLYERGIGVRRDPPAAVQCYAKAAAGGHADARAAIMRCQS